MIDDVVTRTNYDIAQNLTRDLAVELAQEIQRIGVVTPKVLELSVKVLETARIADRLRRQMILEVAG